MPSVTFSISWPDGETVQYYSPSTIIYEFLEVKKPYSHDEFFNQVTRGLDAASNRVMQKFGYACSAAADEKRKITRKLESLTRNNINGQISVCAMS
ncbi:MAG TPA: MSMEG_0570 family nitrogen starvation response protein [Marinagarivorans sp.]